MAKKLRIGILTGGGDCPGLNPVLRAVVRAADRSGRAQIIGIEDGYEGLIQPGKAAPLRVENVHGILPLGGTILGSSNRANPFSYVDAKGNRTDQSKTALRRIKQLSLDGLFVVGGDGTLIIAHQLSQLGVPIIGLPKTIDNDIACTELSFGFDTAVSTAMWALDKLHTTAESHDRLMILEVMGRSAGWIALHAGLAGGADAILVPEIPYYPAVVAKMVKDRAARGKNFSIIVVAEGAVTAHGKPAIIGHDIQGHPRYGGAGDQLAAALKKLVPHEVRVTVLGHLQRGGSPSSLDRILGSRFGAAAVDLAVRGIWNRIVALRGNEIVDVPLAGQPPRLVDPGGDTCAAARALGVTFGEEPRSPATRAAATRPKADG